MNDFFASIIGWLSGLGVGLVNKVLAAVVIAVIGVLLIRLIMQLLMKTLEKSNLSR